MRAFLIALASVHVVIAAVSAVMSGPNIPESVWWWLNFDLTLVVVPVAGAWLGASIVHTTSRRRWFDRRAECAVRCALAGLGAGALGAGLGLLWVIWIDGVHEALGTGAGSFAAAVAVVVLLPRARPGRCVRCGYSLEQTDRGCCPECGGYATLTL